MSDEDELEDVLQFLAAVEQTHGSELASRSSFDLLVGYSAGKLAHREAAELESRALSDAFLRERLLETVIVVRKLGSNPLAFSEFSPLRSPLQFEIARAWRRLNPSPSRSAEQARGSIQIIGRDEDIRRIEGLLVDPAQRLITITGPGGVGKTCLLRKIGESTADAPMIECSGLGSVDDFYQSLREHLKLDHAEDIRPEVVKHFQNRDALLLLDRLDDLAVLGPELGYLLDQAPGLKVLATSRAALGIVGERAYELAPLGTGVQGDQISDSVALFAAIAQRFARDFRVTAQNIRLVRELCRLALGVPLSICIAAGCMQQQSLPDLVQGLRSSPSIYAPQRSPVEAAIANSFLLLSEQDRAILGRLGVFAGAFSFDDAQFVSMVSDTEVSDCLVNLQRCGLVEASIGEVVVSYAMHDSVHDYVASLGSSPGEVFLARNRHAAVFATKAEQVGALMKEGRWGAGIGQLLEANSNLRAAMRFSVEQGDRAKIRRFADGLARTYFEAGFLSDFETISGAATDLGEADLTSRMLGLQGALASIRSDENRCEAIWKERLALCRRIGNVPAAADTLTDLAWQCFERHDVPSALEYLSEAQSLSEQSQSWELLATACIIRARIHATAGEIEPATRLIGETMSTLPKCENRDQLTFVYQNIGIVYNLLSQKGEAVQAYLRLLREASEGHRAVLTGWSLRVLGPVFEEEGDLLTALRCHVAAVLVHNEYSTKHQRKAADALNAFCARHAMKTEGVLHKLRSTPWPAIVRDILRDKDSR